MTAITLEDVGVEFVLYGASRSLKKAALNTAVGGLIGRRAKDSRTTITALRNVDLSLKEGDRVALIGHNGAGKTTLLRVLAGIYHPTSGAISIQGRCVPLFDIGLGVDDEATGRENIVLRGLLMGLPRDEIKRHVDDIAAFSGLGDFFDLPVRTYSAGMLVRLIFSIATSIDTDILLMDEWIAAGDADFIEKANLRLFEMIGRSKILVLASHSVALLRMICNRAVLLEAGTVVATGDVDDMVHRYSPAAERLGASGLD